MKHIVFTLPSIKNGHVRNRETLKEYVDHQINLNGHIIGDFDFLLGSEFHVRASGRTTLLALSYLNKAIENKGKLIQCINHSEFSKRDTLELMDKIKDVANAYPEKYGTLLLERDKGTIVSVDLAKRKQDTTVIYGRR